MERADLTKYLPSAPYSGPARTLKRKSLQRRTLVEPPVADLKRKSVRGGVAAMIAQGLKFGLQTGSLMILARLLSPKDFGLQGMVVAMTGVLGLFRDLGLSAATIQRDKITHEQVSTLFWINVLVGVVLTVCAVAMAPLLVIFYKEPRLFWVTIVSSGAFLFNGLGVQHQALLDRSMRFVTLAKIDVISLGASLAVGIGMAMLGCGYWSLVGTAVSAPMVSTVGAWLAMPWLPGKPYRRCGVRSMLHFGGTVTLNGLVVYVSYNLDKMLLGRFWGAAPLGLYGRSYQLANLPIQQLNSSLGSVAFPAYSRIQSDAARLGRAFLKGYSVMLSMTIPVTLSCAVFAEEIVRVLLGPKWGGTATILRLLSPTVLAFALVNPFGPFLQATGQAKRSLRIAFLIAPVVILGIVAGLHGGPKGVALGYSTAMILLVGPIVAWATHGTGITLQAYCRAIKGPLLSGLLAGALGLLCKLALSGALPDLPLLLVGLVPMFALYAWFLLVPMRQKALYADLAKQVLRRSPPN
jgi:O-antigen/teichoic acid export membrane protein